MSDHDRPDVDDTELAAARQRAEAVLAEGGLHVDDVALWADPSDQLEESIMAAISSERGPTRVSTLRSARSLRWLIPLTAAAAVLIAFTTLGDRPDWTVTLGATDAAPGAVAVAAGWNEDDGTRVQLDVTGLEPAPDGFFYELWFSNKDVHISAGSFHGSGNGITLWAGVARSDFPRVWITLEPIDNDPAPGVNMLDTAAVKS